MTTPTLVVFDLDHTLYEYDRCDEAGRRALFAFADDELGVKSPAFEEAFTAARENVKRRLGRTAASHSRLLYCHEALELIGLRSEPHLALVMEQEYWRTYLLTIQLRPGAIELLQTLRYNGVMTAVVTDLTAQIQFRKLHHLDLTRMFDHVVCSEETRGEKVSLDPFRLLFERTTREATARVWFVGDQHFDAPVGELTAAGLIGDGRGFVLDAPTDGTTTGWRDLRTVEDAFHETLGSAS